MEFIEDPDHRAALDWDDQKPEDEESEKPVLLWPPALLELRERKEIA